MPRSRSRFWIGVVLLAFCFPAVRPDSVLAQKPARRDCPSNVAVAQEFLQAVYPEVRNKDYTMVIGARGHLNSPWINPGDFAIVLRRFDEDRVPILKDGEVVGYSEGRVLDGQFMFERGNRIHTFILHSEEMAHDSKNRALQELVESHPEWSDQRVVEELKRAGARYGPEDRQALLKVIPLEALQKFFGKITITSAEFDLRHIQEPRPLADLLWTVHFKAETQDVRGASYYMILEPFEGRLRLLKKRSD